jgi:ankyrin repeat protein
MSDSKELSVLEAAVEQLINSDDATTDAFCHNAADVSAFEDALQQCSAEHFQEAAAATLTPTQTGSSQSASIIIVQDTMKERLRELLSNVLNRNNRANHQHLSWSVDGYSTVVRLAKSILSNWCIDKQWIDCPNAKLEGMTILMQAAEHGHTSVVELLLVDPHVDKASIDRDDEAGWTALMQAAFRGHVSIVELLLADPRVDTASIGHAGEAGWTALMQAVSRRATSVVELLLAHPRVDKACIDHANNIGWTALIHAAFRGNTSIVEVLLADSRVDRASIDHASNSGETALSYAGGAGHASVVELLLAHPRVDKDCIDHVSDSGWTTLMYAGGQGHASVVEVLLADPRVDKASMDHTCNAGHSVLWYAAHHGHVSVVQLMAGDSRSSWNNIVEATKSLRIMAFVRKDVVSVLIAELTRRQMCVIFPSRNRQFWPMPASCRTLSDAKCDVECSGDGVVAREQSEDNVLSETPETDSESECALITSFFISPLFDVNVLRIIREYATYTI